MSDLWCPWGHKYVFYIIEGNFTDNSNNIGQLEKNLVTIMVFVDTVGLNVLLFLKESISFTFKTVQRVETNKRNKVGLNKSIGGSFCYTSYTIAIVISYILTTL